MKSFFSLKLCTGVWLTAVVVGLWAFTALGYEPDELGRPDLVWPEGSQLTRAATGHTLVVALHPECPCSVATLTELAAILKLSEGRLQVRVICVDYPELCGDREREPDLWRRARLLPGVELVRDLRGMEAARFMARTSGEVRLYDAAGRLCFYGGITGSRGHAGENLGTATVLARILGRAEPQVISTPVFGCAL